MEDKKEIQQGIIRTETKRSPNGMTLEEKTVNVYGKDLKEVKEIFDKEWERKDE